MAATRTCELPTPTTMSLPCVTALPTCTRLAGLQNRNCRVQVPACGGLSAAARGSDQVWIRIKVYMGEVSLARWALTRHDRSQIQVAV